MNCRSGVDLDRKHVALSMPIRPTSRPDRRRSRMLLLIDAEEVRRPAAGRLLSADAARRLKKACLTSGFFLNFCWRCRECDRPMHEHFAGPADKQGESAVWGGARLHFRFADYE